MEYSLAATGGADKRTGLAIKIKEIRRVVGKEKEVRNRRKIESREINDESGTVIRN